MDFRNEALNMARMQRLLEESEFSNKDVIIPDPVMDLTSRRCCLLRKAWTHSPAAACTKACSYSAGQQLQPMLDMYSTCNCNMTIPTSTPLCRVLTMQWVPGVKLTTLPPDEIKALAKIGQEAFLTQLLEIGVSLWCLCLCLLANQPVLCCLSAFEPFQHFLKANLNERHFELGNTMLFAGFFHGDPHPGNLLKITEGKNAGKLVLLDFGLVAEIPSKDREAMVSAVIHLANKDWDALCGDFVSLGFLPADADRKRIIPVMDKVLTPYLRGGGARSFNFQALSQVCTSADVSLAVARHGRLQAMLP